MTARFLYIYKDPERTEVANYCGSSTPTDLSAALGSCLVPRLRDLAGRELFQLPHLTDGSGYHDLCDYDRNWWLATQPSVLQYVCFQWGSSRTARKALRNISNPAMSQLAQRLDLWHRRKLGKSPVRLQTWCKLQDSCSQVYLRPGQRLL